MPKTQEELSTLKQEYESLNNKLKELIGEELKQVIGGAHFINGGDELEYGVGYEQCPKCGNKVVCINNYTTHMYTDIHCTNDNCDYRVPDHPFNAFSAK